MAAVTGDHAMLPPAVFLLALQLVGINVAGAVVFRLFGVTPTGARYQRGRRVVGVSSLAVTLAALAALLWWQLASPPARLERDTVTQRVRDAVLDAVRRDGAARAIEANVRFSRAAEPRPGAVLVELYVERGPAGAALDDQALRRHVSALVRRAVAAEAPSLDPRSAVTIVSP